MAVFGLRAVIPTGYMLAAIDGHTRLIVCPASVHYAVGDATMSHGVDMDHGAMAAIMHHAGHAAAGAEHCPFALASGASLVASLQQLAEPYYSLRQPTRPPLIHSVSTAPPARYHAPRGPPSPA